MRKYNISIALLLCVVALLSPQSISAALSQTVEGTFEYKYEDIYLQETHGKTIFFALEHEWWNGTFDGTAHAVFIAIVNEAGSITVDLLTNITGTVNGIKGSLVIRLTGEKPSNEEDWIGNWEIIRGIGELANCRGRGTWGGPGYEGPEPPDPNWDPVGEGNTRPDIWYKGTISTEGGQK